MRRIVFALIALATLVTLNGCDQPTTPPDARKTSVIVERKPPALNGIDLTLEVTIGNCTYIPVNHDGLPDPVLALQIRDQFKRDHPDLEITSWQLYWIPGRYNESAGFGWVGIYWKGMFVDHRPLPLPAYESYDSPPMAEAVPTPPEDPRNR
ncbi:MAG TPA: hypothetical protein VJJ24_01415 [Candidatus Paceibacterota bacterium]